MALHSRSLYVITIYLSNMSSTLSIFDFPFPSNCTLELISPNKYCNLGCLLKYHTYPKALLSYALKLQINRVQRLRSCKVSMNSRSPKVELAQVCRSITYGTHMLNRPSVCICSHLSSIQPTGVENAKRVEGEGVAKDIDLIRSALLATYGRSSRLSSRFHLLSTE